MADAGPGASQTSAMGGGNPAPPAGTMRVALCPRYGGPEVVRLVQRPTPTPGPGEILIRTMAATVTSGDARVRGLDVAPGFAGVMRLAMGVRGPRRPILGSEVAGVVVAVGAGARRFRVGDPVFAFTDMGMGCHAEYIRVAEGGLVVPKPDSLSFAEAAALSFGGTTALHFFRKAGLRAGERVLVNGASGGVGTAAVQLAIHRGAEVTAVCSGAGEALVRSLGAHHVIDYTRLDFTRNGERYDLILDVVGTAPWARSHGSLAGDGRLVLLLPSLTGLLGALVVPRRNGRRVLAGAALGRRDDVEHLAHLAGEGAFCSPIDRTFPFDEIVEAHRYVSTGRKKGNVVLAF